MMSKTRYLVPVLMVWLVATASAATLLVPSAEYPTLQDALAVASGGDEIWVAEGLYRPDEGGGQTPGDRDATFQLKNGVALYGGFSPGDSQWEDRDPNIYTTILSGDLDANDEPDFVNNGENSRHVVTGSGTDETAILDGFTITGGHGQGGQGYLRYGAGMYNVNARCMISNCVFSYNLSNEGFGGGMYNENSSPTLVNCSFIGNSGGENGCGAMYNATSDPTLRDCTFTDNFGYTAAMCNDHSSPLIVNCTFNENSAIGGSGGVYNREGSCPQFFNCIFSKNTTNTGYGGGMKNANNSSPTLTNCTFTENSARKGAGISNFDNSHSVLYNCRFIRNQSVGGFTAQGAGMFNGSSSPVLKSCVFVDNLAEGDGGAVYNVNISSSVPSAPELTNCTFIGNQAGDEGGGVYNKSGTLPTLTNCILWNNSDAGGTDESAQIHGGSPIVEYSCIEGLDSIEGAGNIADDPLLAEDGIHLMDDSPCINAGDPAGDYLGQTDIDGEPRLLNGRVDIGADEFRGPELVGLEIAGPNEVLEETTAQYEAIALYGDSSSADVTSLTQWSVEPNEYADIDELGLLIPEDMYEPVELTVYAHYAEGEYSAAASKAVSYIPVIVEYHVDANNGDDNNDGLSRQTAFATIQRGIDATEDGDGVLVYPAVYAEAISFEGKAITVAGLDGTPIIEAPEDFAVSFYNGEGPESVFKNFVIRDSFMAIFIAGSSPTLHNLNILDNLYGIEAYVSSAPDIRNCVFQNNTEDLFQCQAHYSFFAGEPNLPDGLVAYWPLDEGAGDTAYDTADGNHGLLYGDPDWTTGQIAGALEFDGDGDYVRTTYEAGPSEYSISLWYNLNEDIDTSTFSGFRALVSKTGDEISDVDLWTIWFSSTNGLGLGNEKTYNNYAAVFYKSAVFSSGQWHHVVVTGSQTEGNIYFDGELKNSVSDNFVTGAWDDSVPFDIARPYNGTPARFFNGKIDDVQVHSRVLTGGQIQQLYADGLAGRSILDVTGPLFVDPANDDYHLLSERGRYWPQYDVWVLDDVTSPCIDGGDPAIGPVDEPAPNGARINIGAFGGTAYASMSDSAGRCDLNHDGIVNMVDFAILAGRWLNTED